MPGPRPFVEEVGVGSHLPPSVPPPPAEEPAAPPSEESISPLPPKVKKGPPSGG